ncbi:MAG: WG repeat-containing protein [Bacteroidetes bacterium]|nr:WG repeat-containing protein [Bacteroidota bacterium]
MKCASCQGEWTPPENLSLSKCPFCQTDILQKMSNQAEVDSTEAILGKMLQLYGFELLKQDQRLSAMISDLFSHDKRIKKMLLLSVKEKVPEQIFALENYKERETRLNAIQLNLKEEAFLNNDTAHQIISVWRNAIDLGDPDESFEIIQHNYLYGFRNIKNKIIIPCKYSNAEKFSEGLALVVFDRKHGFIDKHGKEIIPFKYDDARPFEGCLAKVNLNGKWVFIDKYGDEIIPIIYDSVYPIDQYLVVKTFDIFGLYDRFGNIVIDIDRQYRSILPVEGNHFIVWSGSIGHHLINSEGAIIIKPIECYSMRPYASGLFEIDSRCDGSWPACIDYVNIENHFFKNIKEISEGLRLVRKVSYRRDYDEGNRKYGYLSTNGKILIACTYDYATSFNNGKALVQKDGETYFIDKIGNIVLHLKNYNSIHDFIEGFSIVRFNDLEGFIDENGEEICEIKYSKVDNFHNGIAKVKNSEHFGFINKNGREILDIKYNHISAFKKRFAVTTIYVQGKGDYFGLINDDGIEILPVEYNRISILDNGWVSIWNNEGKGGFVNPQGIRIIPDIYENLGRFEKGKVAVCINDDWIWLFENGEKCNDECYPERYAEDYDEGPSHKELLDDQWEENDNEWLYSRENNDE